MNKTTLFLITLIIALSGRAIAQSTWQFDDSHSNLQFSATHLMVAEVEGSIKITEATLTVPGEDFSDATVSIRGDMSSIDTDNDGRDQHLRSSDFFDVAQFPFFTFNSSSFQKVADKKYLVTGMLSFHGFTKVVTLDVTANTGVQPWDNATIVGFIVSGTIKRTDFGIGDTTPSAVLSDEVSIEANVIFGKS